MAPNDPCLLVLRSLVISSLRVSLDLVTFFKKKKKKWNSAEVIKVEENMVFRDHFTAN